MALPTSGYPGTLDTTNATPGAGVQFPQIPAASTDLDASNVEHDLLHTNLSLAIVALQTKLGITDSNAAADKLLIGSGASTTAWTSTLPTVGFGTDGSGVDVTWYSDTAGDTMLCARGCFLDAPDTTNTHAGSLVSPRSNAMPSE